MLQVAGGCKLAGTEATETCPNPHTGSAAETGFEQKSPPFFCHSVILQMLTVTGEEENNWKPITGCRWCPLPGAYWTLLTGLTAPQQPQHTSHQRPVDILRWEGFCTFPTTTATSRQSYFQSAEDPQAGQAQIISQMGLAGEQELWSTGIMRTELSLPTSTPNTTGSTQDFAGL